MIPVRYWIYIGCVIAAGLAVNWALSQAYDNGVKDQQQIQQKADALITDLRNVEKERIEDETQREIAKANNDADRAAANAAGLRGQIDEIRRIAINATGAFAPGTSARDAVILLSDLLQRCSERYTTVARFADQAHTAGKACERSYDSLRKSPR